MKRNNRGFTLVEVLVSIVMVALVVASVSFVLVSSRKIEKRLIFKENSLAEINNLYQIFTSSPTDFFDNIVFIYPVESEEDEDSVILRYNSEFRFSETGEYSITCKLIRAGKSLTLTLEIDNGFEYDEKLLSRTILVGEQHEIT